MNEQSIYEQQTNPLYKKLEELDTFTYKRRNYARNTIVIRKWNFNCSLTVSKVKSIGWES